MGKKHRCERETLISCLLYVPQLGTKSAVQACALTGNRTGDLLLCELTSNQLSPTGCGSMWLKFQGQSLFIFR